MCIFLFWSIGIIFRNFSKNKWKTINSRKVEKKEFELPEFCSGPKIASNIPSIIDFFGQITFSWSVS